jgi:hypothetical protein
MFAITPSKLLAVLAAGAFLAAAPIGVHVADHALSLSPAQAQAKQGADDKTSERRGRGANDTKADDHGGKKGGHGADDTKPDDHGGKRHR